MGTIVPDPGIFVIINKENFNGGEQINVKVNRKLLQYIVLAAVLIVGGYAIGQSLYHPSPVIAKGSSIPDFKLVALDGSVHDSAAYAGKPMIINFWGTFCPPCREEMPALQSIYEEYGDQVTMIGINLSEDKVTVSNFVQQVGVTFPILFDRNRMTEKKFGLRQYPTTFFVRPDGKVMEMLFGLPLKEEQIRSRVEALLATS